MVTDFFNADTLLFILFILPVSIPLVLALVTALTLNPVIRFMQRKAKISRKTSVIIVFLLFLIFLSLGGAFIVTKAVTQVVTLLKRFPPT